jgi:hypothetical protein
MRASTKFVVAACAKASNGTIISKLNAKKIALNDRIRQRVIRTSLSILLIL